MRGIRWTCCKIRGAEQCLLLAGLAASRSKIPLTFFLTRRTLILFGWQGSLLKHSLPHTPLQLAEAKCQHLAEKIQLNIHSEVFLRKLVFP